MVDSLSPYLNVMGQQLDIVFDGSEETIEYSGSIHLLFIILKFKAVVQVEETYLIALY
jgi:hypothetical protein